MLYGKPCSTSKPMRPALVSGEQDSGGSDESEDEVLGSSGGEKNDGALVAIEGNRRAIHAGAEKTQRTQGAKNKKQYDKRHRVSERAVAGGAKVMRADSQSPKKMAEGKLRPK